MLSVFVYLLIQAVLANDLIVDTESGKIQVCTNSHISHLHLQWQIHHAYINYIYVLQTKYITCMFLQGGTGPKHSNEIRHFKGQVMNSNSLLQYIIFMYVYITTFE